MTAISSDLRPDDHDHANPLPHDLPDEVCAVTGYACASIDSRYRLLPPP